MRKGMIIAVASHDYSNWAGRTYGHVGVIVEENGQLYVRDNIGHINMTPIDQWIDNYNNLMEVKWGWPITV